MLPPLSFVIFAAVKVLSTAMISLVKAYQWVISPLLGSNCRHTPTCSAYTIEAIKIWGPFKGAWLGIKRILRCHPWGSTGWDPVPKKKNQNQINK